MLLRALVLQSIRVIFLCAEFFLVRLFVCYLLFARLYRTSLLLLLLLFSLS